MVLVGFATNRDSVVAADEWGAPMEDMKVPPGAPGSWEDVLHQLHVVPETNAPPEWYPWGI